MATKKGLTLIELTLYIAIVSMFVISLTTMLWNVVWGKNKNNSQIEVYDNLNLVTQKLKYEATQASDFTSTAASNLTLVSTASSHGSAIFKLNNGKIQYGYGTSGTCTYAAPCDLTSNLVTVSTFSIQVVNQSGSKVVNYAITMAYNSNNNPRLAFTDSINGSYFLKK